MNVGLSITKFPARYGYRAGNLTCISPKFRSLLNFPILFCSRSLQMCGKIRNNITTDFAHIKHSFG